MNPRATGHGANIVASNMGMSGVTIRRKIIEETDQSENNDSARQFLCGAAE